MTLNIERMRKLAEYMNGMPSEAAIRKKTTKQTDVPRLNMHTYLFRDTCGTVGCIAGYTCVLFDEDDPFQFDNKLEHTDRIHSQAAKHLGLTEDEAHSLFINGHFDFKYEGTEIAELLLNICNEYESAMATEGECDLSRLIQAEWVALNIEKAKQRTKELERYRGEDLGEAQVVSDLQQRLEEAQEKS